MIGTVRHVRIQRAQGKQSSLSYGFVKMGSPLAAARAIAALDGYLLAGRKLRVRYAAYRVGGQEEEKYRNSLYIKFVGAEPGASTNEQKIREVYSVCGALEDVNIRKISVDKVRVMSVTRCVCYLYLIV